MWHIETNGTHFKSRATLLPPPPHPPGQGACSLEAPCDECAAEYETAYEERDTVEEVGT